MSAYTKDDRDIREERILGNMLLVRRIARSYARRVPNHVDVSDLESAGTLGLIRAVDCWQSDRGVALEAFAIKHIRGAVLDHLRAQDPLPYSTRVKIRKIEDTALQLEQILKRFPDTSEIAHCLETSVAEVSSLMGQASTASLYALEDHVHDTDLAWNKPDSAPPDPAWSVEWMETRHQLSRAIANLGDVERRIVSLYYFERLKMKEIAAVLEVSESRVSQLHARAVLQLRARLREAVEVQE